MSCLNFSDALRDLCFSQRLSVDEAMDTYFAPGYTHRNSGQAKTRAEFAAMAARAREQIASGEIQVLDEFRDGDRYSERHILDITNEDGGGERAEINLIGRYATDGRFLKINEAGFSREEAQDDAAR
ncbi:nuclear transport factor 2 family protein [Amycolatopsis sp. NPDC049253]|uniref:nuclear transport factor 2 family protein n=1 Tax=Amycolatopsis sp. NPDC049253 TaxID=3155274 RepID=UPI003448E99C